MTGIISAVLVHVSDVEAAIDWYRKAFPQAVLTHLEAFDFSYLKIGNVDLEIVPADEKVASGTAGSVVYWHVDDFDASVAHFMAIGGTLYRGPLAIQDSLRMCQIKDPWGNCIGLRG
ncbi:MULTISPECIES: VOC family protein [Ochrobactrum]|jgi:predicted enzyme related to lactoylglutathione lyase|uniref:Glyoxalase-like domain protein n=1 Tax=Ochrobactrum quorumnocens TaxID=271865 RepID=A0A248UIA4_9HYPH|nr:MULTISPECIES: VOC family protein [Brucella/Ochrobactrum group]MBD7991270.1 glyoxalase/bleomycin resistance/dioxygenase family protein [Ochrobactrum gallinarum]ASV86573.1 glyoxalase-like domain protein [[Ochrobactrum] quorumnocens]KAA9369361.1 glyoxalase/bleomycin resistance/dioxygenase family protein [[Ochrobactrum] quorumnocens]MCV9906217.1 glyoxalase/bleomycin resistance/dioxygenase family protein [Brucella sp. HL-2]MDH7790216.1 putative enzyme related to lactoylglutathione lyase [Ochroba